MSVRERPWMKFYPSDWRAEPRLRNCGLASRGLWMEMLALMHESGRYGYLLVNDKAPADRQLAIQAGATIEEVSAAIAELESEGVFSRDRHGTIYSRRMIRDEKRAIHAQKIGKKGGNPTLGKRKGNSAQDNPTDNQRDNGGVKAKMPEARDQSPESATSTITPNIKHGDGADAPSGTYAFFGRTIRLKPNDLERWRRTFHSIADLDAELSAIDAWFEGQDEAKRKQWFHVTAGSLNRKHQELLASEKQSQAPPAWDGMP